MSCDRVGFNHMFAIGRAALFTRMFCQCVPCIREKAASRVRQLAELVTIEIEARCAAATWEVGVANRSLGSRGATRHGQKLRCARKTAENTPVSDATKVVGAA